MVKLNEINEMKKEVTIIDIDGFLFENEENAEAYLDSCDAILETFNFEYDREDFEKYMGSDFYDMFDWDPDSDEDDNRIDSAFVEYQERVDELCDKYDIDFDFKKYVPQGPLYILSGKLGDLKKFAEEYASHIEWDDEGEALYHMNKDAQIDLESGDDSYIL